MHSSIAQRPRRRMRTFHVRVNGKLYSIWSHSRTRAEQIASLDRA